jgi:hypothetical protein
MPEREQLHLIEKGEHKWRRLEKIKLLYQNRATAPTKNNSFIRLWVKMLMANFAPPND